jgi:hypothetical protein
MSTQSAFGISSKSAHHPPYLRKFSSTVSFLSLRLPSVTSKTPSDYLSTSSPHGLETRRFPVCLMNIFYIPGHILNCMIYGWIHLGIFSSRSRRISAAASAFAGISIDPPEGFSIEIPFNYLVIPSRRRVTSKFRSVSLLFDTLDLRTVICLLSDLHVKHLEILSNCSVIVNCLTIARHSCQHPLRATFGVPPSFLIIVSKIQDHSISVCFTANQSHITAFISTKRYLFPLFYNTWVLFQVSTPSPSDQWSETKVQYLSLLDYSKQSVEIPSDLLLTPCEAASEFRFV